MKIFEIFSELGVTARISPQVRRQDQFERMNGGGYDAEEFEAHPERYVSNFSKKE